MHTIDGDVFRFHYNSDASGDVHCCRIGSDEKVRIPADDLKLLVANFVRTELISRLEQMEPDEVLRIANRPSMGDAYAEYMMHGDGGPNGSAI